MKEQTIEVNKKYRVPEGDFCSKGPDLLCRHLNSAPLCQNPRGFFFCPIFEIKIRLGDDPADAFKCDQCLRASENGTVSALNELSGGKQ